MQIVSGHKLNSDNASASNKDQFNPSSILSKIIPNIGAHSLFNHITGHIKAPNNAGISLSRMKEMPIEINTIIMTHLFNCSNGAELNKLVKIPSLPYQIQKPVLECISHLKNAQISLGQGLISFSREIVSKLPIKEQQESLKLILEFSQQHAFRLIHAKDFEAARKTAEAIISLPFDEEENIKSQAGIFAHILDQMGTLNDNINDVNFAKSITQSLEPKYKVQFIQAQAYKNILDSNIDFFIDHLKSLDNLSDKIDTTLLALDHNHLLVNSINHALVELSNALIQSTLPQLDQMTLFKKNHSHLMQNLFSIPLEQSLSLAQNSLQINRLIEEKSTSAVNELIKVADFLASKKDTQQASIFLSKALKLTPLISTHEIRSKLLTQISRTQASIKDMLAARNTLAMAKKACDEIDSLSKSQIEALTDIVIAECQIEKDGYISLSTFVDPLIQALHSTDKLSNFEKTGYLSQVSTACTDLLQTPHRQLTSPNHTWLEHQEMLFNNTDNFIEKLGVGFITARRYQAAGDISTAQKITKILSNEFLNTSNSLTEQKKFECLLAIKSLQIHCNIIPSTERNLNKDLTLVKKSKTISTEDIVRLGIKTSMVESEFISSVSSQHSLKEIAQDVIKSSTLTDQQKSVLIPVALKELFATLTNLSLTP
ncbi:MAG: hypothetical protein VX185_06515 [Pseudomonadota bacterium]|nr:hypothetical protein [Pseudomonadota bacterium]